QIYISMLLMAASMSMPSESSAQSMTVNMRDGQKYSFNTNDIENVVFDASPKSQGPFQIEVSDITSVSAKLTVTPDDPDLRYYFDVCDKDDYEHYGAEFIVESYFTSIQAQYPGLTLAKILEASLSCGNDSDVVSGLPADTEMVCYAIGIDDQGKCVGEASAVPFRTLPGGDPADCTFDISYTGLRSTELTVIVKPSDPSVRYWMGCYSASEWPGDITMAQAVKETLDEYTTTYGKKLEDVVRGVTFTGDISVIESGFEPSTSYYIYAYAMDEQGEPAGPMFKKRFTTSSYDYSEAQLSLAYRYFDGDALAEAYPEKFANAKGQVVLQAVFTPNEATYNYAWALAMGDLTDEDVYPEYSTKNAVLQGGFISVPAKNLYVRYGKATFLYFAADEYGIDGQLGRTLADITPEGASPASAYKDLPAANEAYELPKFNKSGIQSYNSIGILKRINSKSSVPMPMRKCF
ncbi:MAG: hypothetical protein K2L80_10440, partial [Muribaculaceae bacterium]|nr:hypothetical protein [Muribaculaceae bacterium]